MKGAFYKLQLFHSAALILQKIAPLTTEINVIELSGANLLLP